MNIFRRALLALICSTSIGHAQNCWTQSDLSNVTPSGMRVIQPTTPPATDTSASKYLPATDFASGNLIPAQTSIWSLSYEDAFQWVYGSAARGKPNPPPGPHITVTQDGVTAPCFLQMSTTAIADAATWSNVAYIEGRFTVHSGRGWLDYTRAASIPDANVLEWAAFVAGAPTLCTGVYGSGANTIFYMMDYVVEPAAKLSTVPTTPTQTVYLDYERHDGATPTETNSLVYEACQNLHGRSYQCGMYNNPLNGPLQYQNGIDGTNVNYLVSHVDQFGIYPFPKSGDTYLGSFNEQMAMLTSPPCSKLNLQVDMAMADGDASALRTAAFGGSCVFGGAWFFYDGQTPGGACTTDYNVKEQTVLGIP